MHIPVYDEKKRSGLLRHVLLRYGKTTKQIMVVLVINSSTFPARKNFVNALIQAHPNITTIIQNVNTRKTSIVLGNEERVLYGSGTIEDELCGMRYRISPKSFYQINHDQSEVLYQSAIEMLQLKGTESMVDAYCGIGTIGMFAAQFVKKVTGVEINADAIKDAKINAKLNQIKNIDFVCEDASDFMRKKASQHCFYDIVIMDPPRSGSDETFIKSIADSQIPQVLYISCNPYTQVRDSKLFQRYGYQIEGDLQPVNMFPFTHHVESIVKFVRNKKGAHKWN